MTFRSLRTGLIALALVSGALAGCARVTVFVATDPPDPSIILPFHSDAGRFSVEIPGTFKETVKTTDTPHLGPIEVHYFTVTAAGGPRYAVVYGDLPSAYVASTALEVHFQDARDGDLGATNGRLLASESKTVDGYAAEEYFIDGELGFYRFVSVLVGTRSYSLSVRGTEAQVRSPQADEFITSFAADAT